MSFDMENILEDVKAVLVANFNTKLVEIDTEKNDGVTLVPVESDAYFLQSLDNEFSNYSAFIVYGVTDINPINNGPYTSQEYTLTVMLIASDDGSGEEMTKKMLRYSKALREVFEKNWQSTGLGNKLDINSFVPVHVAGLNDSQEHRIAAIELKTTIS